MTVYQRIMRAARRGTGLRLTWEDVRDLSIDNAIEQVAVNDDEDDRRRAETRKPNRTTSEGRHG